MTRDDTTAPALQEATLGTLFGLAAYGMWGLFPLYWKSLSAVPPVQILAHRIAWAFVFTLILAVVLKKAPAFKALFHNPKRMLATVAAGILISVNWGIYIWAVNIGQIVETSIGYYLNPLISVVLGATVLREKLDKGIIISCVIAGLGITILTLSYGSLPWIALSLAASFSLYGLIKKMTGLDALTGLTAETAVVFPLALAYLWFEHAGGRGSFGSVGARETILLALAGIVTAIPLLAYAAGVKRIPLSRMGFLQYLSPTLQLLLGVLVYGETISGIRGVAFGFVLVALIVFSLTRIKKARPTLAS
ncbi:MAG TPA: EamA family transporter RarD [Spirochaetaceae bacterium]|jgi:chloramphenicol-sensitive protein RarD|nr:EamA family transporter RarD [Spirochaetaceae bacterium]